MQKRAIVLAAALFALLSCTKNQNQEQAVPQANDDVFTVTARIASVNPFKLQSDSLREVTAINKETGEPTRGYIFTAGNTTAPNAKAQQAPIERGYFLFGDCFVYGTVYHGDNGVDLFVPCGFNCIGFDPICPPEGEVYVRQAGTATLKFPKDQ